MFRSVPSAFSHYLKKEINTLFFWNWGYPTLHVFKNLLLLCKSRFKSRQNTTFLTLTEDNTWTRWKGWFSGWFMLWPLVLRNCCSVIPWLAWRWYWHPTDLPAAPEQHSTAPAPHLAILRAELKPAQAAALNILILFLL